jgi:Collagen triple helix repeat (20 copies)
VSERPPRSPAVGGGVVGADGGVGRGTGVTWTGNVCTGSVGRPGSSGRPGRVGTEGTVGSDGTVGNPGRFGRSGRLDVPGRSGSAGNPAEGESGTLTDSRDSFAVTSADGSATVDLGAVGFGVMDFCAVAVGADGLGAVDFGAVASGAVGSGVTGGTCAATAATAPLVTDRALSAEADDTSRADADDDAASVGAGSIPFAACACPPQRSPSANNPPTSSATCSTRRPAAVRVTRRAAPERAAGRIKSGTVPPCDDNQAERLAPLMGVDPCTGRPRLRKPAVTDGRSCPFC